jgi:hypothetical protein
MLGRQIHTAEPPVPEASSFAVEIDIKKLKRCKLPGIDQILAEMIQTRGNTSHSETHKLINCMWNKEQLSKHLFIRRVIKLTSN